jgi:RHS repeat-associated protein
VKSYIASLGRCGFRLLLLLPCLLSNLTAQQTIYDGNNNLPPFGSFHGSDFDLVSLQNGNLHISIPVLVVPQRGKPIKYTFLYDTLSFTRTYNPPLPHQQFGITTVAGDTWYTGWGLRSSLDYSVFQTYDRTIQCPGNISKYTNTYYSVTDPERAKHPVYAWTSTAPCWPAFQNAVTLDGSGISLDLSSGVRITTKDGDVPGLEDTNGNKASATADTLNRSLLTVTNAPGVTYTTPLGHTINGPNYTTWTYNDSSGTPQTWRVDYEAIDVHSGLCAGIPNCSDPTLAKLVPLRLTMPTGRYYQFTWNNNSGAELLRVDLPTGGYLAYTYGMHCSQNPDSVNVSDCREAVTSRTVGQGGTTATWTYGVGGVVTDPYGNDEVHTFNYITDPSGSTYSSGTFETQVKYWSGSSAGGGTLLRTVVNQYTGEAVPVVNAPSVFGNVRRVQEDTTRENGLTRRSQTDYETFTYSAAFVGTYTATRLNVTAQREYDYGSGTPGSLQRQTTYTYGLNSNTSYTSRNIVDRVTQKLVYDGSGNQLAKTVYEYDNYSHPNQPMQASSAVQHDSNYGTSFGTRGNVTAVQQWRNTDGLLLTTTNQYDDAGNVISSIDPLGHQTSSDYTDSWANGTCAPSGQGKAYPTKITNALGQFTTHKYNSCTGSLASATDPNLQITSLTYDLLGRVTQASFPDGGLSTTCFSDVSGTSCYNANLPLTTTLTQKVTASLNKIDTAVFDDLGRVIQTQLNSDPAGITYVDTAYNLVDKVCSVSNPHRSGGDATDGITQYQHDALGRATQVAPPDGTAPVSGSTCPSPGTSCGANNVCTSYSGNSTTVTDQAGKSRTSQVDGLGRLTSVWEDPAGLNYQTVYQYDALDNLLCAEQHGSVTGTGCSSPPSNDATSPWRVRRFTYSSLSELLTSTNPESGAISYSYDNDGNLFQKTAPQANQTGSATTTTTYCYDKLHRLVGQAYTPLTCPLTSPPVQFLYDQTSYNGLTITNGIGRRTGMSDGAGTTAWSFDQMGRPAAERRTLNTNITKSFTFSYNKDGEMQQTVWPTGHQVTYAPSGAGRTVSALGTSFTFVTAATYAPQGAISSAVFGSATGFNGITIADTYNKRLQPSTITASLPNNSLVQSLTYDFHLGTADNGNVFKITNGKDANRTQNFTYDNLNRIKTGATQGTTGSTCWGQKFGYMSNGVFVYGPDPWGNLTEIQSTQCVSPTLSQAITTKNQFASPMVYDAAGNLTNDGSHPFTYDTENRLATAGGVTYTYDGDGKRVKKSNGTLYWTGPGSDPLLETDLSGNVTAEYIFFNGKRVARVDMPANSVEYYFSDHLGSHEIIVNASGGIVKEGDYLPYGFEVSVSGTDPNHYKFTGKERDSESGLDMFGARYYGSSLGRFMTPDWAAKPVNVPYAHFGNPQSLNLYSYVQNNPTTMGDPDGHCTDPFSCGVEFAGIGTLIEPGGGTVVGAALGGIVGGAIVYFGGKAIINSIHHSDDASNKNAPAPATSQNQSQSQSTPADPNQGKPDKGGTQDKEGAQDKKLTKTEVNNLEKNTRETAEDIKSDTMQSQKASKFDLYKNSDGDIVVKPKGSSGAGETTGYTTEHLKTPEPKPQD